MFVRVCVCLRAVFVTVCTTEIPKHNTRSGLVLTWYHAGVGTNLSVY